jgi:alpha-2-macroglobulin
MTSHDRHDRHRPHDRPRGDASPGPLPRRVRIAAALVAPALALALPQAQAQAATPAASGVAATLPASPAGSAWSATLQSASPQGRIGPAVRQIRARLDRPPAPLGVAASLPDPLVLRCTGLPGGASAPAGRGRFTGERDWVFDLVEPLPPGVACEVSAVAAGLLAEAGAAAAAPPRSLPGVLAGGRWRFSSGGPAVAQVRPWPGSEIDEAQHLVVVFNGTPRPASVVAASACEVQGVGDRIPVRLVEGAARDATLAAQGFARPGSRQAAAIAARSVVLTCDRPLPPEARVRLVVGPGVVAESAPGLPGTDTHASGWTVRPAFTAEFGCERERAGTPCVPVRPLSLRFSAPVARAQATQVRLVAVDAQPPRTWTAIVDAPADDTHVQDLRFPVPLPEGARLRIELPADLRDDAGRSLANAARFPLAVATGDAPPIAKFAAAPFGILERTSSTARRAAGEPPPPAGILPITLRHVQPDFVESASRDAPPGVVRTMRLTEPADILAWMGRLQRHHEQSLTAREAGRPRADWFEWDTVTDAAGRERRVPRERNVGTREVSLLRADSPVASGRIAAAEPPPGAPIRGFVAPPPAPPPPPLRAVQRLTLPPSPDAVAAVRPFEVVGLPLAEPGYHVVEVESARLGAALLGQPAPMYVRTGVLVTNLGVHLKHGRENSVVWVTTLDRARPVPGADVTVHDCRGTRLWQGSTDAQGLARIEQPLDPRPLAQRRAQETGQGWDAPEAACIADDSLFVVARTGAGTAEGEDLAFVSGSWQRGIEPWRFDLPVADPSSGGASTTRRAHTVFDRTLLRAGETVSMKHFLRLETRRGLELAPAADRPDGLVVEHIGSGQETRLPLDWAGQRSATSTLSIPPAARLGAYAVHLERRETDGRVQRWRSGEFRVEAFRVPLVEARLVPPPGAAIAPRELPLAVQVQYLAGGGVAQRNATVSALLAPRTPSFPGLDGFRFDAPREPVRDGDRHAAGEDDETVAADASGRIVADRLAAPTDARGAGQVRLVDLPPLAGGGARHRRPPAGRPAGRAVGPAHPGDDGAHPAGGRLLRPRQPGRARRPGHRLPGPHRCARALRLPGDARPRR